MPDRPSSPTNEHRYRLNHQQPLVPKASQHLKLSPGCDDLSNLLQVGTQVSLLLANRFTHLPTTRAALLGCFKKVVAGLLPVKAGLALPWLTNRGPELIQDLFPAGSGLVGRGTPTTLKVLQIRVFPPLLYRLFITHPQSRFWRYIGLCAQGFRQLDQPVLNSLANGLGTMGNPPCSVLEPLFDNPRPDRDSQHSR